MWFTSDNAAGAAPGVIEAMARADEGPAMAYGADAVTERARGLVREVLGAPDAAVHFVATGTAANALALATLTPPWGRSGATTTPMSRRMNAARPSSSPGVRSS